MEADPEVSSNESVKILSEAVPHIDPEIEYQCCELWATVFAKPGRTPDTVLEERRRDIEASGDRSEVWHIIMDAAKCVAAARTFLRTVQDGSGKQRQVLALAHVACDPSSRGRGLGKTLVLSAMGRVGIEAEASLFQTSAPGFYVKLGAAEIRCKVINSTGLGSDPKRRAGFWDPSIMVFPAEQASSWPEGPIDILGPGY